MPKVEIDLDMKIQTIKYDNKTYKITVECIEEGYCICGCRQRAKIRSKYYSDACRKRVSRRNTKNNL